MALLASFNGGVTDAQFVSSFCWVALTAVVTGGLSRRVMLGGVFGALAGMAPIIWFAFLSSAYRPDLGDILLLGFPPLGGLIGGIAGGVARAVRRDGKPTGRDPERGVGDREIDP